MPTAANGVDNEWLTPEEAKAFCPPLHIGTDIRYPVLGATLQRRGGTARHDAVAWGYARAADALGVDITRELRSHGHAPRRGRRDRGARDDARDHPHAQGRRGRGRQLQRGHAHGGHPAAARELPAAGAGVGAGQAGVPLRGDVEHHPRLHQPVGQGRTRHRRRHGFLHLVHAARRAARRPAHARGDLRAVPAVSGACGCCATGAGSST